MRMQVQMSKAGLHTLLDGSAHPFPAEAPIPNHEVPQYRTLHGLAIPTRKPNKHRSALKVFGRDKPPKTAVVTVVAVVAHGKIMAFRNLSGAEVSGRRGLKIIVDDVMPDFIQAFNPQSLTFLLRDI